MHECGGGCRVGGDGGWARGSSLDGWCQSLDGCGSTFCAGGSSLGGCGSTFSVGDQVWAR